MRIGVPVHHAFKSATAHTREVEDEPILATDTDTETLGNRDLEDTTFTIDRPKSGNRRSRLVPKR